MSRTASAVRAGVFADLAPRLEAARRGGRDVVELHIGDTFLDPPPAARFSRVDEPCDAPLYRYGSTSGLDALKRAFADSLAARGHAPALSPFDPERQVLVACGATHALFCAARAVLDPGDEVLVASPYWPLAVGVLRAAGALPVEVPLTTRLYEDPAFDVTAAFERARTPATRALYLINPNNPDGKVLDPEPLARLARFAVAHDLWVLSDEVYADYVYEGSLGSIARHDGMADRTVVVHSLSKSHALAGARVGFAVGPERVVAMARRIATHTVFNVPAAAQRVALAALLAPPEWLDEARRTYRGARDTTMRALSRLPVDARAPEGGSYVFVDFARALAGRPLQRLLERAIDAGVLLAPGDAFGAGFSTWARLCFTSVPPPRLSEGLARLAEAVEAFAR